MPQNNAPYNFISLPEKVFERYPNFEALPSHGELDSQLLSGSIRCTFTAQTPVCVSDGEQEKSDFFRDASGAYVLPGSTIKGLVRTNMLILGMGAMRSGEDFDDIRMLYRVMADANDSVKAELKGDYAQKLQYKNQPPKVSACYVQKEENRYRIYRCSAFFRVNRYVVPSENEGQYKELRKQEENRQHRKLRPYELSRIKRENHLMIPNPLLTPLLPEDKQASVSGAIQDWLRNDTSQGPVWYQANGETVRQLLPRKEGENVPEGGWKAGVLVAPGKMNGQNTLYLFADFDSEQASFLWAEKDQLAYEMDYKQRENSLGGTDNPGQNVKERRKAFWKLPDVGEEKPFFLLGDWEEAVGDRHAEEGVHNPVVIGRSPYLRVGFEYVPSKGLPEAHRQAGERLTLDYPYALLGFASKVNEEGKAQMLSYRSRVAFGDFQTDAKKPEHYKRILAGPKPTSFPDYLVNGKSYNDGDFRLRGIKQYWLHSVNGNEPEASKEKVARDLAMLPEGTQFSGTLRFHNLHRDELGLLLWCLKLDKDCCQSVGMGKPYGFGRMSVTIDSVEQLVHQKLYSVGSLNGAVTQPLDSQKLIEEYVDYIQNCLGGKPEQGKKKKKGKKGVSFRDRKSIADFLFMRSNEQEADFVCYMELEEYRNRTTGIPEVYEIRKVTEVGEEESEQSKLDKEYRRAKAEGNWKTMVELGNRYKEKGWTPPVD